METGLSDREQKENTSQNFMVLINFPQMILGENNQFFSDISGFFINRLFQSLAKKNYYKKPCFGLCLNVMNNIALLTHRGASVSKGAKRKFDIVTFHVISSIFFN